MTKLARTIRFDESDENVFARAAEPGEWAIPGGFEFSNWTDDDLTGKARQAFANGWLGLSSFGRSTFVAVARIEPAEIEAVTATLASHFERIWGAPTPAAARAAATEEISFMQELCEDHGPNTLLVISRELTTGGVRESFRAIVPSEAEIEMVAVHATNE